MGGLSAGTAAWVIAALPPTPDPSPPRARARGGRGVKSIAKRCRSKDEALLEVESALDGVTTGCASMTAVPRARRRAAFVQPAFASRSARYSEAGVTPASSKCSRRLTAMGSNEKSYRHRTPQRSDPEKQCETICSMARDISRCGARRSSVGHGSVGGTLWQTAAYRAAVHANVLARLATFHRDRAFHPVTAFKSIMTGELHASS